MDWIQPGILIAGISLMLVLVAKVFSSIEAIKKGAVAGANLNNSIKQMSEDISDLQKDVTGIKSTLTNGLSSQVKATKEKVEIMEATHKNLMEVWQSTMRELSEIKTRCEERSKWVTERNPGRREYDHDTC